jgi:hypothetical protein
MINFNSYIYHQEIVRRHRQKQAVNFRFEARPTFTEFIQFIINEDLTGQTMDMHWEPGVNFSNILEALTTKREKLLNSLLYEKRSCKMLMKLTPGVNFSNILPGVFIVGKCF